MYGSLVIGAVSSLSGVIINEYFRRKLFVPKSALILIAMPVVAVSSLSLTLFHYKVNSALILSLHYKFIHFGL
jgi:Transmembrane protein 126